jgi:hypothetical protein
MGAHNHGIIIPENDRILASTCYDPANPDALRLVEVHVDAQIEFNGGAPILCLSQYDRSTPGQTVIYDNRDLYMNLDNFRKLVFANVELLVTITKQYQDSIVLDQCGHRVSLQQDATHVYDLITEYIDLLEDDCVSC